MEKRAYPDEFVWGAATAAYQIEGAACEDNRGESIWDRFARTPGRVLNGNTGDVACDHYHLFRKDVALMADLGLQAYRFSIAWPRLFPTGAGPLNTKGMDFYSRLIDALLEAGIEPVPTLYHWDLPQALQDAGGWPNMDAAYHFADYAEAAFRGLGDRVRRWITLNEPICVAGLGYLTGDHAPGRRSAGEALAAGHTLLVAHGFAVERFRALRPKDEIGITINLTHVGPASDSEADVAAAARWDAYQNRWFLDPVFRGEYPAEMVEAFGPRMPAMSGAQRAVVSAPIDFLGVNYYTGVLAGEGVVDPYLRVRQTVDPELPVTGFHWPVYPRGLGVILKWVKDRYNDPVILITENGAAYPDEPDADGVYRDTARIDYLREHLLEVHGAIEAGVRLRGYFLWSLMDNFEWAHGYSQRFGIVHVDYATQRRTPRESARWYARVIADNAVPVTSG